MRKVTLRMNEQKKYEVITKLVETNDNKKRAAVELECSLRTINRLILNTTLLERKHLYMEIESRPSPLMMKQDSSSLIYINQSILIRTTRTSVNCSMKIIIYPCLLPLCTTGFGKRITSRLKQKEKQKKINEKENQK